MRPVPEPVPSGSVYYWCYVQGLRHVSPDDLMTAVEAAGKKLRDKDIANYWRGWYRSDLFDDSGSILDRVESIAKRQAARMHSDELADYPVTPYAEMPEIMERWVPCNEGNRPMIKWGKGCMTLQDASSMLGCRYLAENLKGTKTIVVDCDGDHDGIDADAIRHMAKYMGRTWCLYKNRPVSDYEGYDPETMHDIKDLPASFHLTFETDRILPTMHFPDAHIDIIGNADNSLRYYKTKIGNGLAPCRLDDEIFKDIMAFAKREGSTT